MRHASTGYPPIDGMRTIDEYAESLPTLEAKGRVLASPRFNALLDKVVDRALFITCSYVHLETPAEEYKHGLLFIGQAVRCTYFGNTERPRAQGVTLDFIDSEVLGLPREDMLEFRTFQLKVPVAAIETCLLADGIGREVEDA